MEHTIRSLDELSEFAQEFLATLTPHSDRATVVGLSGELGSGKTAFVKACAKALGVTQEITSPTFVIEKRHPITQSPGLWPEAGTLGWKQLVHIDAYRLESGEELKPLRFSETLADPGNLIFVEWPELVADALLLPLAKGEVWEGVKPSPKDIRVLQFSYINDTTRNISEE